MYIESVPNRNSPAAVLLRESYREDGKVRKRTLANLSCLPAEVIEGLKVLLRGGVAVPSAEEVFTVERTLPHGHVAAVLGAARGLGRRAWFGSAPAGTAARAAGHAGGARDRAGLQAGHPPPAARRHGQLLAGPRAGRGAMQRR